MKNRLISVFLASAMLLSLAACGKDTDTDTKNPTDTTVSTDDTLPAGIESQNYEGKVNILLPEWGLYTKCFDPGDDMTDILNKALYNREVKVEEYLGVDITYEYVDSTLKYYEPVATAVATNDDLYQILLSHCIDDNAKLLTDGYLTDMNNLDIDFSADWFNQNANEALEVNGKQFFCINDYMIPDPNTVIFNAGMIEKNNLEDPYQLVRDGKWTIDKMIEMSSAITTDNGDGIWDSKDTYGFATPNSWYFCSFIHGADVDIIQKNENDEFELIFGDARSYTLMEKLDALLNGPDTYIFSMRALDDPEGQYAADAITIDRERSLFSLMSLNLFWSIRDIKTELGILPFPKLDEQQEEYYSLDWSGLMSVPFSVSEDSYEMIGDVIELLAYHSEEEVIPAYIEDTLGKKFARDPNWSEMLEIIFGGIVFDPTLSFFGHTPGPYELLFTPAEMLDKNNENTFASWLATHGPVAESVIADFNEAAKNVEG